MFFFSKKNLLWKIRFIKKRKITEIELFSLKNQNFIKKNPLFCKIHVLNTYSVLFCKIWKFLFFTKEYVEGIIPILSKGIGTELGIILYSYSLPKMCIPLDFTCEASGAAFEKVSGLSSIWEQPSGLRSQK